MVLIHSTTNEKVNYINYFIDVFSKFAVPMFIFISGYFVYMQKEFIKENFNITREEFRKKMGFEDRTKFYPILEKEFERDFPFLYLNIKQIRRVPIFQKIKNDICLTPVNIFIKNNEILPMKYGKDRNYNEFKEILEDFKNKI